MNKSVATIILILVVVGGGFFAYTNMFSGGGSSESSDEVAVIMEDGGAGAQLIVLLNQLQSLRLSDSIFNSAQFLSLRDLTTVVINEPVGRSNPFAPIGRDGGFVSSTDLNRTVSTSATSSASVSGSKPVGTASTTKPVR